MLNVKIMNSHFKRAYVFLQADRSIYRSKIILDQELVAGPDFDSSEKQGHTKQTPAGDFLLSSVIDNVEGNQRENLLLVKADSTGRCFPRGLKKFSLTSILLAGDSHHQASPIRKLLQYALDEDFDIISSEHDRHHLHYFMEAGFQNVIWLPGFNTNPHKIRPQLTAQYSIVFIGSVGKFHPYRKYLLDRLIEKQYPIIITQADQAQAANFYNQSIISLNISLNGDLNFRVFEVLAAGGFLLTDRLSIESGLFMLFEDGKHLVTFSDEADLEMKLQYYLSHPHEAKAIAQAGYEHYWANYSPEHNIQRLLHYLDTQEIETLYRLDSDLRTQASSFKNQSLQNLERFGLSLDTRIRSYEVLQEAHLHSLKLEVLFDSEIDPRLITDAIDLPRLRATRIIRESMGDVTDDWLQYCKAIDHVEIVNLDSLKNKSWQWYVLNPEKLTKEDIVHRLCFIKFEYLLIVSDQQVKEVHDILETLQMVKKSHNVYRSNRSSTVMLATKKLKILIVTNLYPPQELGGYGRSIADFANGLQRRNHNVRVLTTNISYLGSVADDEQNIDRTLKLWGTYETQPPVALSDTQQIAEIVQENWRFISQVVTSFNPDICLVGNIDFLGRTVIDQLLSCNIPVVHHLGFPHLGYSLENLIESPIYCIAANSRHTKNLLTQQGVRQSIATIYPGAVVNTFYVSELPKHDKLKIAYASLVIPIKGAHTLVEATRILQELGIDFDCTIAGDCINAEYQNQIHSFISAYHLENCVRLVGRLSREELRDLYRNCNVLVFPSIWEEPFGISQVEAMAAGLTLVTSGTGGAAEIVEHEVSGLTFPAGDAIALAQTLISLPQNPDRWARLAATGQARAFAKFDIERSIDQLELKFEELLRRKAELSSPMAPSVPTTPAADPYTQWLCDRLSNVLRVYALDTSDRSTIDLLRELRRQCAEVWQSAPADQLQFLYQGPLGQAYRSLLTSGFQGHPLTEPEAAYLQALTTQVGQHTVQHPVGLQAFLGVMLYLPSGKMRVEQAQAKLPAWLLPDYWAVFERDLASGAANIAQAMSAQPVPPQPIAPAPQASVPLYADMTFLNRLLGCANLYYIDPEERSIADELRLIRQQVGQIWAQTPFEHLEALYRSEFGRRYVALLDSGYQHEPLRLEEESVVQELTGLIGQGIDRYPGLNALLAIMMYLPPGKMQVRDAANRLPAWLLPDYQRIFESGATQAPSPIAPPPTAAPAAPAPSPIAPPAPAPASITEDMVFLNRFLGCSNLYEIDPDDPETVAELRNLRRQVAEFWLTVPADRLEATFNTEFGRRYGSFLKSGFQREPLTEEERNVLVRLAETVARGLEQPGGLNAFLGAMMYYAPGQMQVKDAATRLPGWLYPLYAAVFESEAQKKMLS